MPVKLSLIAWKSDSLYILREHKEGQMCRADLTIKWGKELFVKRRKVVEIGVMNYLVYIPVG